MCTCTFSPLSCLESSRGRVAKDRNANWVTGRHPGLQTTLSAVITEAGGRLAVPFRQDRGGSEHPGSRSNA